MKGLFSLVTLLALPATLAFNAHDTGVSRRHHHLERKAEEVALPAITSAPTADNTTTHELSRRAFTNAKASWYKVGLGACGLTNGPSDFIVALNAAQFGNGYPGPHCFKKIRISYKGISAVAEIRDRCPGCPYGGLDFSEGLFRHFASLGTGIIYTQWEFLDGSGGGDDDDDDDKPTTTKTTTTRRVTTTTRTTTTTRSTSTTRRTSTRTSTSTSTSTSRTSTSNRDNFATSRTTTTTATATTSATPTPTAVGPDNINNLLQALLQMTELLSAASRDVRSEEK